MYHVEYIPEFPSATTPHKPACSERHFNKSMIPDGGISLLYGNGCSRHQDCFTCPLVDCKYDYSREYYARKDGG